MTFKQNIIHNYKGKNLGLIINNILQCYRSLKSYVLLIILKMYYKSITQSKCSAWSVNL